MDPAELSRRVQSRAHERGAEFVDSFPAFAPLVLWPDEDLDAYLDQADRLGVRVLYADGSAGLAGFAVDGILHAFAVPALAPLIVEALEAGRLVDVADPERALSWGIATEHAGARLQFVNSDNDDFYDYRTGRTLEGDLRQRAERLAADVRYDGYRTRLVPGEFVDDLSPEDAEAVTNVAASIFGSTVETGLEHRAGQLVPLLAEDPEFDPTAWGDTVRDLAMRRYPDEDSRVIERLTYLLPQFARESGLTRKAEKEDEDRARRLRDEIPTLVRDRAGFSSRVAAREAVLEPYLDDVQESRRSRVVRAFAGLEEGRTTALREARYATAARALERRGMTKSAISRTLGISNNVIDRIRREHPDDVNLDPEDPILTTLTQGL